METRHDRHHRRQQLSDKHLMIELITAVDDLSANLGKHLALITTALTTNNTDQAAVDALRAQVKAQVDALEAAADTATTP